MRPNAPRSRARATWRVLWLGASLAVSGCTALGLGPDPGTDPTAEPRIREDESPMSQRRMELIFLDQVDKVEGGGGMLRTVVDGVQIFLISDAENDRMRIMAPIVPVDRLPPRYLNVLLEANFHATLDARYAVSEGVVYGIFLHPISTLTRAQIASGFEQVLALAKNFGTTFSSGKLTFPGASGAIVEDPIVEDH